MKKNISYLVENQIPDHIRESYPVFVEFIKLYYKWMESDGNPIYELNKISDYYDVDETVDAFVDHLRYQFANSIPADSQSDIRTLIKHSRDFYRSKGSELSIEFIINAIYGKHAHVDLPSENLFIPSYAEWGSKSAIIFSNNTGVDYDDFIGGVISADSPFTGSAVIISARQFYANFVYAVCSVTVDDFDSNDGYTSGDWSLVDNCTITLPNGNILSESITTTIEDVSISNDGAGYSVGDVFSVPAGTNSLSTSGDLVVTKVSQGPVYAEIDSTSRGFGYTTGDAIIFTSGDYVHGSYASAYISRVGTNGDVYEIHMDNGGLYTSIPTAIIDDSVSGGSGGIVNVYPLTSGDDPFGSVGSVVSVVVANPGNGYTTGDSMSIIFDTSGDVTTDSSGDYVAFDINLGAVHSEYYKYSGNNGRISDISHIHDGKYHQLYSYVVSVYDTISVYGNTLKRILHPAGKKMIGQQRISASFGTTGDILHYDELSSNEYLNLAWEDYVDVVRSQDEIELP